MSNKIKERLKWKTIIVTDDNMNKISYPLNQNEQNIHKIKTADRRKSRIKKRVYRECKMLMTPSYNTNDSKKELEHENEMKNPISEQPLSNSNEKMNFLQLINLEDLDNMIEHINFGINY